MDYKEEEDSNVPSPAELGIKRRGLAINIFTVHAKVLMQNFHCENKCLSCCYDCPIILSRGPSLDLRTLVADGPIKSVSLVGWVGGHLHSWKTALTIS